MAKWVSNMTARREEVDVREARSIEAKPHAADPLPVDLSMRDPAEVARDLLRAVSRRVSSSRHASASVTMAPSACSACAPMIT